MPNSYDFDPRSPSNRSLVFVGVCLTIVTLLIAAAMVAKSKGTFDKLVRVNIELVNIGDGLPERSDVKFRGVLVGMVSSISPSRNGQPNIVHVDLKPGYAAGIPNTVTARVVPANLFAVSAVQLIDNGKGSASLRNGSVVREDKSLPTVLFQNVLAKLHDLLFDVARDRNDHTIGVLEALSEATRGRGQQLTDAGRDLNQILAELNTVVSADASGPSTLSALTAAAAGLRRASPELFDALDSSIRPMRTFAEKRVQLTDFLSGGLGTVGTLGDSFDHQTDRLITISTELTPALGVLGEHARDFHGIATRMKVFANKLYDEGWDPDGNRLTIKAVVALTPSRRYVRADCPRYGALAGPSCQTAPEVPTAPDLSPALGSQGVTLPPGVTENRPNVTPPRHSMPDDPQGPVPPAPGPRQLPPFPPGSAQLGGGPGSPATEAPAAPAAPGVPAAPAPGFPAEGAMLPGAVIGGNVGPVGSHEEKDQLGRIVGGGPANSTVVLLLGPVARDSTVHITSDLRGGQ
ncbi:MULTISPECIES: MCE family protein [Mycobacterium]|uniref:Mce family protein n=2 Tax=Mycobacterium kiyosense TaxID=2871094 RepID=A0AA37V9C6_9MYCO|nr:putative Mce family protein [Mycobacterium kiyosense]BDE16169.1 putative Mce family protein [Mycobacterium sp. 20KCMC460]GLB82160.1 putative Mce family protein [Mycobacterium kiyosense]GLB90549.1 putative Mce family protein [Mycobacterium kiyosense]GLB95302.1 putative Mce family protein [Mycobacterium kiyosense]